MTDSLLAALVQEELESVVFVRDYLQLDFGTARFSAYVWPIVRGDTVEHRLGDPSYRDALCALISSQVTATEESTQTGLVIAFGATKLVTHSGPAELRGPEIALLAVSEGPFQGAALEVWRAGEGIFSGPGWS